jgi:hypothetical protein
MAALSAPAVGNGATVSGLGQTTFVKKVTGPKEKLGTFSTTDLSTTEFETVKKKLLADTVVMRVECYHIGSAITLGSTGTFTYTLPSAGSYAGTGIVTAVDYPDAENGMAMMGGYEITFDGMTGPAFTAA